MDLWDFHSRGRNEILLWSKDLSKRDRAALNQKLDLLSKLDFELAQGLKLLAGPIRKTRHVLKLRVFGDTALRPLLCRGPDSPYSEYTLLRGAKETDRGFVPQNAVEVATQNRRLVADRPEEWRCPHVRA
jgi:hypothetical protein